MNIKVNQLYQTDALELLERLDNNIADIIYLDPPWNLYNSLGQTRQNIFLKNNYWLSVFYKLLFS